MNGSARKPAGRQAPLACGISACGLALIIAALALNSARRRENGRASADTELAEFRLVPEEQIGYTEVQQIDTGMAAPTGLALDSAGTVYVCGGSHVFGINGKGARTLQLALTRPATCIAVTPEGDILCGVGDHIEVYDRQADAREAWDIPAPAARLSSLVVTADSVFVADAASRAVWRYDRDGNLMARIGEREENGKRTGFIVPGPYLDVCAGDENSVWATNPGRLRVERFAADGTLLATWGLPGMAVDRFCGCCNPTHIAAHPGGGFVTSEKGLARVKEHRRDGSLVCVVAGPAQFTAETVGLDLAVDQSGRVYVLDPKRQVIRVFARKPGTVESHAEPSPG